MPPMHVDYIAPVFNTKPQIFNISAVPDSFYSQYDSDSKGSDQSTHTDSTWMDLLRQGDDWSFIRSGQRKGGRRNTRFSDTFTATQDLAKNYFLLMATTQDIRSMLRPKQAQATTSGLTTRDSIFYIYPVIGQLGCPD